MTENEAYKTCFEKPYIVPIEEHEEAKRIIGEALSEIQQYRAIGTIEEFKALKEKNDPKRFVLNKGKDFDLWHCPKCNKLIGTSIMSVKSQYCSRCGQKLD